MRLQGVLFLNLYPKNRNRKKTPSLRRNKKFYLLREKHLIGIYLLIINKINRLLKVFLFIVDLVIIMKMSKVVVMLDFLMRDKCFKIVKKKYKK